MTDAELDALYDITGDNECIYLGQDLRSSGEIYAISKNVYDALMLSSQDTVYANGWTAIDNSKIVINIAGVLDNFNMSGHNGNYPNYPCVKATENGYYMWGVNHTFLGDVGWENSWNATYTVNGVTFPVEFHMGISNVRVKRLSSETGALYEITEEMFGSFVYTGKAVGKFGKLCYELDNTKFGFGNYGNSVHYPIDIDFNSMCTTLQCKAYTYVDSGHYYLFIEDETKLAYAYATGSQVNRLLIIWINNEGKVCQQFAN